MPTINQFKTDPKISFLTDRIRHTIDISMERVAAHLKDKDRYLLPADPHSVEKAMTNLLSLLSAHKRKKFIKALDDRLTAGSAKRHQWYGDLAEVDFKSSKSITEQVKAKTVPAGKIINEDDYKKYRSWMAAVPAKKAVAARSKPSAPAAAAPGSKLAFNMVDLTCVRTSELHKDEISIGAFFTEANGNQLSVNAFEVGDFKKGETFTFPAGSQLSDLTFEILQNTFPQTFVASFFLLEKDLIRDSKVVNAIIKVFAAISIASGAVAGVFLIAALATMNVLVATIGLICAAVLLGSQIILKVLTLIADDVSGLSTDILVFDTALPNIGDEFSRSVEFQLLNGTGGLEDVLPGKYTANLKWSVK